jgi:hypothetical protein
MLWLLLIMASSGFLVEGARIARDFPAFERWSPAGYLVAVGMASLGLEGRAIVSIHRALWISHAILVLASFVVVPLTLLKHIVLGAYSVMFPGGRPGLIHEPEAPVTGPVDLAHFRRIDWLQADACLTCGRCTEACPAAAAGKPLSPRAVVLGLREHLERADVPLARQVVDDALWCSRRSSRSAAAAWR